MGKRNIIYLDGWNIMIAQNSVAHITDHNSNPIGMYLTTLNMIRTFVDKFKPVKIVFALDGPEAGERRRQLFENYKNKRRITGRQSKVRIMEGEDNMVYGVEGAFQNQLIKIYDFLKLLPVTTIMVPFAEADDLISNLALKNKDEYENVIISNDKDYLQLIQDGIKVYRWRAKKLYEAQTFLDEFKIIPQNYIYMKIMLGDAGDVVPGIKGIGKVTFQKFHRDLSLPENDFGDDVQKFIDFARNMDLSECNTREKNAIIKMLSDENIPKIELAYKLMKLDLNCMNEEQLAVCCLQIEEQKEKRCGTMMAKIKMNKNNFNKLYNGFNEDKWIHPFVFVPGGIDIKC